MLGLLLLIFCIHIYVNFPCIHVCKIGTSFSCYLDSNGIQWNQISAGNAQECVNVCRLHILIYCNFFLNFINQLLAGNVGKFKWFSVFIYEYCIYWFLEISSKFHKPNFGRECRKINRIFWAFFYVRSDSEQFACKSSQTTFGREFIKTT